jgi:hypothetical protein
MQNRIAKKHGLSVEAIQDRSPSDSREYLALKSGRPLEVVSEFPTIGKGTVLREEINKQIDALY